MTFRDVELVFPIHIWENLQYLLVRNYLANLKIITTTVLSEFLPRLLYPFLIIFFLLILSFEKHGCQGGWALSISYVFIGKGLKIVLSETTGPI